MKPGVTNVHITKVLDKITKNITVPFSPLYIDGELGITLDVMSYQLSKGIINGYNEDEFIHQFVLNRYTNNYDITIQKVEFEHKIDFQFQYKI